MGRAGQGPGSSLTPPPEAAILEGMAPPDSLARTLAGKRFGLVFSAGFFGFYGHAGFLAAVEGAGLEPSGYAGTSAGALVASLAASGLGAEKVRQLLHGIRRSDFWDPAPIAALVDAARGKGFTGFLAGRRFRALLEKSLPVHRIEETKVPLVLVTADISAAAARVHTEGDLAEVIHASCAYPGLFRSVPVEDAQLWDGGLVDKAPLLALAERVKLDALLVHYLPSADREPVTVAGGKAWHGYTKALARGMVAVRHDNFELQARLCEAKGLPVYVAQPKLPRLGPGRLSMGRNVIATAAAEGARVLSGPAAEARPFREP